ncbi:MAG TPA: sterol desaturase family protein [Myxococcota bacterium]|nr:sterol desaturase family protein [Myxococcota bacterium]
MAVSREFVRRLGSSRFNYWFGYVANLGLVAWLWGRALVGGRPQLSWAMALACAVGGLLSWTLSEYLLHRYVYHVWPSFLSVGHDLHHRQPKALIGVPWWLSTAVVLAVYQLVSLAFDPAATGVIMGFNWLGYVAYCLAHHGSHHWSLRLRYFRQIKRAHLLHHAYPDYNWGFTTPLWDILFGTRFPDDVAPPRGRRPKKVLHSAEPTRIVAP